MRPRRHVCRLVLLGGLLCAAGCLERGAYVCQSHAECVTSGGDIGRCEAGGACSFPDSACPSGWRYGDLAPASQAGQCVGGNGDGPFADASGDGACGRELCGDGIDSDCMGDTDPTCPVNDLPEGALDLGAGGGVFTADLTYAHDDAAGGCSGTGGRDLFYQAVIAAPEIVYVDTFGSDFDTVVRWHPGACTTLGAELACNDNACAGMRSQLATRLTAGTWCLVVDQESSAVTTGATVLTVRRGGRDGTAYTGADPTGNTCTATDRSTSCIMGQGKDVGYYFTLCPAETRMLTVNTCGTATWDTGLYARSASMTTDLACVDDFDCMPGGTDELQSRIGPVSITGPDLFWVILDGYMNECGAYTLDITLN